MTSKHTPGPWLVHSISDLHMDDRHIASVGHNLKVVSHTAPEGMTPRELMANARLIAAAPRLLEALRGVLIGVGDDPCRLDHDGYCQAHDVSKPCNVASAREALGLVDGDV